MGFNTSSGSVYASINTISGQSVPSSTQSVISVKVDGTGAAQTIYTVTAGKTFYCYGWGINANGATSAYLYATNGTTIISAIEVAAGSSIFQPSGGCPLYAYPAGTAVKINTTAGSYGIIWGIEQ